MQQVNPMYYPLSDFQGSAFSPATVSQRVLQAQHSAALQSLSLQTVIAHAFSGRNALFQFQASLQEKRTRTVRAMCTKIDLVHGGGNIRK